MRIFARMISLLSLLSLLQACEVEVENGRLPPEYMPAAREFEGTYTGEMDHRPGSLVLSLKDDGYVEVTTPGFEGADILDEGCGSKIGDLLRIAGDQKEDKSFELKRLVFDFSRTNMWCIAQREIKFDFGHDEQGRIDINASLVLFYTSHGQPYTIYGYFVKE